MQYRSFKAVSIFTLFFFLATPISVFAQGFSSSQLTQLLQLQTLQQTRLLTPEESQLLQTLVLLQRQQPSQYGYGQNPGLGAAGSALGLAAMFGQGGQQGGLNSGMLGLAMMGGGGLGGGGGGGGGPVGSTFQMLTMLGAITGNQALTMIGALGSMISGLVGGFGGGMGSTPQKGSVDEQYVAQGQAGPSSSGSSSSSPYYPTPTPGTGSSTPAPSVCKESIFIVKDTTVTPNAIKLYPAQKSIDKDECVLAINSDSASHKVQAKKPGSDTVITEQTIEKEKSHAFRFPDKNTYTLCVDGIASACTTVTVK